MLSSRLGTGAYNSVEDAWILESTGDARSCSPDRVGGDSQQESDLYDEDDKVLPGAVVVAGLELLSDQEDHPQHYHLRNLHDDTIQLRTCQTKIKAESLPVSCCKKTCQMCPQIRCLLPDRILPLKGPHNRPHTTLLLE